MIKNEKNKINVLLNIDNYFGEHRGRLGPVLKYLAVTAAPVLLYVLLQNVFYFISFRVFLLFEILYAIVMALLIIGRQEERVRAYRKTLNGDYDTIDSLMRIVNVHEDGLLEYMNGDVCYIVSGYTRAFEDDGDFSEAMENFLHQISGFDYDVYLHLVFDEERLQDNSEWLYAYSNEAAMKERMDFYIEQDEYCLQKSKLYRYNFCLRVYKAKWKTQRMQIESMIASKITTTLFDKCYICDKTQAEAVVARDIGAYIQLSDMLRKKYENDNYYGSRVLFYGDDIPEEYRTKVDKVNLKDRRIVEEDE